MNNFAGIGINFHESWELIPIPGYLAIFLPPPLLYAPCSMLSPRRPCIIMHVQQAYDFAVFASYLGRISLAIGKCMKMALILYVYTIFHINIQY
jgi:hypothetical protein